MAYEQTTTTQLANHLVTEYRPGFMTAANEEMVVGKRFFDATSTSQKINNALVIRIVAANAAQSLAPTTGAIRTNLTFNQNTEVSKTISPSFIYSGLSVSLSGMLRIRDDAAYKAAQKKQLLAALATQIDVTSAALATQLITNVVTATNTDLASIADVIGKLVENGKDHFKIGQNQAHFVLYSKQAKYLIQIPTLISAYIRGDKANPVASGWVYEALNSTFEESGNVYTGGGATAHNFVTTEGSHAIGYGIKPMLLDPQQDGAATTFLAVAEHGEAEIFDEYAVDFQTSSS